MSSHRVPTPAEDPTLWANSDAQVVNPSVALLLLPTAFVALRLISRWMAGAGLWVCFKFVALSTQFSGCLEVRSNVRQWDDLTVVLGMASHSP